MSHKNYQTVCFGVVALLFISWAGLTMLTYRSWKGYQAQVLLSNSMQPVLSQGELIFSKRLSPDNYRVGDIITFYLPGKKKILVTHRVIGLYREEGQLMATTKGDANPQVDGWQVPVGAIIGKQILAIPWIGYLVYGVKTQLGFLVFTLIFFVFIVWQELQWLKGELLRMARQAFSRDA